MGEDLRRVDRYDSSMDRVRFLTVIWVAELTVEDPYDEWDATLSMLKLSKFDNAAGAFQRGQPCLPDAGKI